MIFLHADVEDAVGGIRAKVEVQVGVRTDAIDEIGGIGMHRPRGDILMPRVVGGENGASAQRSAARTRGGWMARRIRRGEKAR